MGEWGVTVLEATGEVDGGDVWGTATFRTREAGKSSLYRHEVRRAAVSALLDAMAGLADPGFAPRRLDHADPARVRPPAAADRARRPARSTGRRTPPRPSCAGSARPRATRACSTPSRATEFHLFGVHRERGLRGRPGEIIATRHGAICRATVDGAVWITHLKRSDGRRAQAARHARAGARRARARRARGPRAASMPRSPRATRGARSPTPSTAGVGYLRFDFYNGAMSTEQCRRLLDAYRYARGRRADQGHRARGRQRLLLQRHPPQRHRGGARTRARSPGGTCTRSTTSCAR